MKIYAPGKLVIAGEWAMLQGNKGIIAAVNKGTAATIEISKDNRFHILVPEFEIESSAFFANSKLVLGYSKHAKYLRFVSKAIETTLNSIDSPNPFTIELVGQKTNIINEGGSKKIGFGSSASSVVATVAAILAFHGCDIEKSKDIIYKISAISHYFTQKKLGSAFDIAASTYGGVFSYKMFDSQWLVSQLENNSIKDVVNSEWRGFYLEQLDISDLNILTAWTNKSSSTAEMIKQMNDWESQNIDSYNNIIKEIADLVEELSDSIKSVDKLKTIELIRKNGILLGNLTAQSGVPIETPELKMMSELANKHGAAGKVSGAGGGDCGIAVSYGNMDEVKSQWNTHGFKIVDVAIDSKGVRQL